MKTTIKFINFIICVIIFYSCAEENFNPYNEDSGYMVHCVLDNRLSSQFAVMQRNCLGGNIKKMSANTVLLLSENNGINYKFRDTVIEGYKAYSCFYLPGLKLKRGCNYRLSAFSDTLEISYGEISYFPEPKMRFADTTIEEVLKRRNKIVGTQLRKGYWFSFSKSEGYLSTVNLFIDYELHYGSRIVQGRKEIPRSLSGEPELDYEEGDKMEYWTYGFDKVSPSYPNLYHSASSGISSFFFRDYDEILYALRFLNPHEVDKNKEAPEKIIIKCAFGVFHSIDRNYYALAGTGTDISVRLDETYYFTNITTALGSGSGFFGAHATDTLFVNIKPELIKIFGYEDKQNQTLLKTKTN